jgi:hypothetical protein
VFLEHPNYWYIQYTLLWVVTVVLVLDHDELFGGDMKGTIAVCTRKEIKV